MKLREAKLIFRKDTPVYVNSESIDQPSRSVKAPRFWEGPNNSVLAEGIKRYPNATLVDWHGASVNRPELFWDDGIHLQVEGAAVYAQLVRAAIK